MCDSPAVSGPNILDFEDKLTGLKCRLNLNDPLEILRSALILTYTKFDERFKQLAFFLKEWARAHSIPLLTPYVCCLMAIHYLQSTVPPVLPSLQQAFASKPKGTTILLRYPCGGAVKEADVYYEPKIDKVRVQMKAVAGKSGNTASLGEILAGFFRYYGYEFEVSMSTVMHTNVV